MALLYIWFKFSGCHSTTHTAANSKTFGALSWWLRHFRGRVSRSSWNVCTMYNVIVTLINSKRCVKSGSIYLIIILTHFILSSFQNTEGHLTQNIKKKNKEKTINSIGPVYNILNQSRTEDSSDKWNQDVLGRCIKIKCFWTKFPVCLLRISLLCCLQPLKVDTLGKITCHISKSVDKMCEDVLVQVSSQNNLCTCVRV